MACSTGDERIDSSSVGSSRSNITSEETSGTTAHCYVPPATQAETIRKKGSEAVTKGYPVAAA